MSIRKNFVSWIVSSVLMFTLSYLWHGIILNDFARLSYPRGTFLTIAAIVYLVIGFVLVKVDSFNVFEKISRSKIVRGLLSGISCGVIFYMIALVVGVSFSTQVKIEYIFIDLTWQALEQGIGGVAIGLVGIWMYNFLHEDF